MQMAKGRSRNYLTGYLNALSGYETGTCLARESCFFLEDADKFSFGEEIQNIPGKLEESVEKAVLLRFIEFKSLDRSLSVTGLQ